MCKPTAVVGARACEVVAPRLRHLDVAHLGMHQSATAPPPFTSVSKPTGIPGIASRSGPSRSVFRHPGSGVVVMKP